MVVKLVKVILVISTEVCKEILDTRLLLIKTGFIIILGIYSKLLIKLNVFDWDFVVLRLKSKLRQSPGLAPQMITWSISIPCIFVIVGVVWHLTWDRIIRRRFSIIYEQLIYIRWIWPSLIFHSIQKDHFQNQYLVLRRLRPYWRMIHKSKLFYFFHSSLECS